MRQSQRRIDQHRVRFAGSTLALAILITVGAAAQTRSNGPAAPPLPSLDGLKWRHIGPAAFGGRIDDVEAVPTNPWIIFVGAASGGLFKSTNNGVTWRPVMDAVAGMQSVGDIAIAPSDPNIVWVGTGEPNNRQSSSWGDGVYRSLDGGETWTHMGLRDTHHIGRVVIHPRDPNTVFVAALGHLWGPNAERGLYRTKDGGRTWQQVLAIDNDTGVVDVAMDSDGRTLFAASYQRRRRGWGFVGGGPGSGLHRSLDGGDTWEKLTTGLPQGAAGRIGVEISKSHPNIVYAVYEHKQGGMFRSDDRGATWTKQSSTNSRPMYYSQIRIDPKTPDKLWLVAGTLLLSIDAGKTFRSDTTADRVHVDHHAMWINPANPEHMMLGNDGGLYFTYDGSRAWHFVDNLPIGQYYDIGIDNRDPYWIYGGTQDNGTWGLPSRTNSLLGITNLDVVNIAYGDGFYTQPDPRDHRVIYANSQNGRAYLVNFDSKEEKGLRPVPVDRKETYRYNWSTPLLISPHDPDTVYYGANKLLRTSNRGHAWEEASPDLTKNLEWKKLEIMGGERNDDTLSRDDGVSEFGTITTISESPVQPGLLYVGTDDGLVQMTRDGGKKWEDVTKRFKLPGSPWVSKTLASRHRAEVAYVAFDGHQDDDFKPYVFKTTDFGATWTSVSGDLPNGVVINTLAEHHRNSQLLFAGTESGLFYTIDGGRRWTLVHGNLPRVPIDDLVIAERENDLILGTHGRSIIVLDDITPLETLAAALTSDAHLFAVPTATIVYMARMLPTPGASRYSGPNPEPGALITYALKDDPPKPSAADAPAPTVRLKITDAGGAVVRELKAPDKKGVQRLAWDLRYPLPFEPTAQDEGWFGPAVGPFVLPGEYTVTLSARGRDLKQTVQVRADPRTKASPETLRARLEVSQSLNTMLATFMEATSAIQAVDKELARLREAVKAAGDGHENASKSLDELGKKLDPIRLKFRPGFGGGKFGFLDLLGQLQASTSAPTEAQVRARDHLKAGLLESVSELNSVLTKELAEVQAQLAKENVMAIKAVAPPQ